MCEISLWTLLVRRLMRRAEKRSKKPADSSKCPGLQENLQLSSGFLHPCGQYFFCTTLRLFSGGQMQDLENCGLQQREQVQLKPRHKPRPIPPILQSWPRLIRLAHHGAGISKPFFTYKPGGFLGFWCRYIFICQHGERIWVTEN